MFEALQARMAKWLGKSVHAGAAVEPQAGNPGAVGAATMTAPAAHGAGAAPVDIADVHDAELLEQARQRWLAGDWSSLTQLDIQHMERHPARAKLCLMVASAWMQQGEIPKGRVLLEHALKWGCDKTLVAQLLVSGVHNTLGKAAAAAGDHARLERHFREAVVGGGRASARTSQQRCDAELQRLGLPAASANLLGAGGGSGYPPTGTIDAADRAFYRAFEDRFRGSRDLIKQRVRVYLPFVQPVAQRHPHLPVLDLGCGRGEWLEVLGEVGIPARGVDVDPIMLAGCTGRGLTAQQGDALTFLRQQAHASHVCISLMHVVEHLPFEVLQQLVKEARRVLVDDGILIMETPNPENYTVGACNFYMDPTHRNPLPPPLLAFLPEYYGFGRVKIVRLQEPPGWADKPVFDAADYLTGISPDYAVLAQSRKPDNTKNTPREEEEVWEKEYGIHLHFMQARNAEAKELNLKNP